MIDAYRRFRTGLVVALIALGPAASRPASATDHTDIWWAGPTENGWGVNLVQEQDVVFATFYVYNSSNQPTWYSSPMFVDASGNYNGTLYATTGPWFGGPWTGSAVAVDVGTSTFAPTSATAGTLTYTVKGTGGSAPIMVSKDIQRTTFRTIDLGGKYAGTARITWSQCADSSNNGVFLYAVNPEVFRPSGGGNLMINFVYPAANVACTMEGWPLQEGQLFRVPTASYTCPAGAASAASLYEVRATAVGIEGRWTAKIGGGCQEDGAFTALRQ